MAAGPKQGEAQAFFAGLPLARPLVVGIVNVTPDSFSDGGETPGSAAAVARGLAQRAAGADIIDVGGCSTRPGADPVSEQMEMDRVLPVVARLAAAGAVVSVDSWRPAVIGAALAAGARIVNDVRALSAPGALDAVAATDACVILMHMRGQPATMQQDPQYDDVVAEVADFLAGRIAACEGAGIARSRIAVDPGIGFGKTLAHNLTLIRRLDDLAVLGCPVVLGVSRKSMFAAFPGGERTGSRLGGSIAAALAGAARGARILRVHDVAETVQALALSRAIETEP